MVAKRWSSEVHDVFRVLEVFDKTIKKLLPANLKPKKYPIKPMLKVLVIKEFLKLPLNCVSPIWSLFKIGEIFRVMESMTIK
jgi:hypothetical protein